MFGALVGTRGACPTTCCGSSPTTKCAGRCARWRRPGGGWSEKVSGSGEGTRRCRCVGRLGRRSSPACTPHNHRCNTNVTHPRFVSQGLDKDTVATRMHAAGYDTGYFGKYMNGLGPGAEVRGAWLGSLGRAGRWEDQCRRRDPGPGRGLARGRPVFRAPVASLHPPSPGLGTMVRGVRPDLTALSLTRRAASTDTTSTRCAGTRQPSTKRT